jgi:Tfp pilus assembly protein PilW
MDRRRAGFSIVEMMVATMIMMTITGAVFALMNPAQGTFQAQPEVSDMQQRMRVGVDVLTKDLMMTGAGL